MRVVCEGCGEAAGARDVFCPACGLTLPGREPAPSEAAPPGWLVASERGQAAPVFEPLPSVTVPAPDTPPVWRPGWSVRQPGTVSPVPAGPSQSTSAEAPAAAAPPPRRARALVVVPAAGPDADEAALAAAPLRLLYIPLLCVVLLSASAAVVLLVLHVLRDR